MLSLFRIDDRLIHGQVMTSWSKVTQAECIVIADDTVILDEFVCSIMKRAVPKDIHLEVLSVQAAITYLKQQADDVKTILLVKTAIEAQIIIDAGIQPEVLNIGGMGMRPGRKKLYKNVAASAQEVEALKAIKAKGIDVQFQILPGDKKMSLEQVI